MAMDPHDIATLARLAGLHLTEEEAQSLAPGLRELLSEADKVNAFMAPRRDVGPAVRFRHTEPVEPKEG